MFQGQKLIDFGAGTGENTVYLANWGAKCTLVEMNDKAQKISKEIFQKYTNNFKSINLFILQFLIMIVQKTMRLTTLFIVEEY